MERKNLKKVFVIFTAVMVILGWAAFACSPKASPTPTATPRPNAPNTVTPGLTPTTSPESSAWAQTVAAARKEGELTPYTFVFTGDFATVVERSFEQAYGIKISPVVGSGSMLSERIKSEQAAGKNIADTFDTAASTVAQAKLDGLTASIGPIPQLQDKTKFRTDPQLDPDGHFVGTYVITTTIYVNTNLVKPGDEPKSYKDLIDPKWKGKIVEATPVSSASINRVYLALKKSGQADDAYWSNLAKQDLKVVATVRDAANILARGEAAILPAGQSVTMTPLIIQGAPVKPVPIAEGIIVSVGTPLALVKNAPHPNAARVFINWVISPDGQKIYQDNLGVIPLNKDLPESVPPGARLNLDKVISINLADELEVARIQRVGTVAQLLGVAR